MSKCLNPKLVEQLKERARKGEITAEEITNMLPTEKQALKSILQDFVSEKLGVDVKPEEIREMTNMAKKIDNAQKALGDDLGNPLKVNENMEFFKAKKTMDDYLMSKVPSGRLKILTGTIGRGMMLFSAKSPILNIGSNIEVGFTEALSRRISGGTLRGADNKLAVDYVNMANRIYQKTGYDISRMTSLRDTGNAGGRVLGEMTHSQGPGATRKAGQVVEDIVFKQLMGAPDVAFASTHFADSVNLGARKIAKGNKAKAQEYMKDAMKLNPETIEGEALRQQAILDAQTATWTGKSWASDISEGVRGIFNKVSGDWRVGDYLFPFVKTPANVIATGMDYAGMGIPRALITTVKAFKAGEVGSKAHLQSVSRNLVRSGLGIVGALAISSQLKDDDFVGAYDPGRAQIEQLRNSNYNAIRVGDKWISVDWLGPLSVPVSAMMYAKKYGKKGIPEMGFQYIMGVGSEVKRLPGIEDAIDFAKSQIYKKDQSLESMTGETGGYVIDQLSSRLIPGFIPDIAKIFDTSDRVVKGKGVMGAIQSLQKKIPGARNLLPEKKTIFGETVKTEPWWTSAFFGTRIKTDKETRSIKELNTLTQNTGKNITFTDWDKSTGKTLSQFKERVGNDKFNQAKSDYGSKLKLEIDKKLNDGKFKKLSDEEKLKEINGLDTDVINEIYKKFRFKYTKEKIQL